ncbi:hypothetical protein BCR34DRAFT_600995 [Clohesyomyces aquaticus]|uniref:UBA domain-containing protein n=1 Tax=Clohesyomyces aquaticus TaxID=1231657 RepID=A0A1Y1ZNP5_9PLEO|nr:hypothetical protein BCR34DRAFT_600995 [Clohesyomyces aquaticus]
MTRIILDSEDELDDDVESPPRRQNTSTEHVEPSSTTHESGTGSTESLKRAIEATHRAHFQARCGPSDQSARKSTTMTPEHRSKRRKTSTDGFTGNSPSMHSGRRKPMEMYSRSKSVFSSPFRGESPDEARPDGAAEISTDEPPNLSRGAAAHAQPSMGEEHTPIETGQISDPSYGAWGLDGTIRANYAEHEPLAMFPETSSTIPNATYTQEKLLDQVMSPTFLGVAPEPDMPPYEPAQASIPWSEYLRTSPTDAEVRSDQRNAHAQAPDLSQNAPQPITTQPPHSENHDDLAVSQLPQSPNLSQRSRRSSVPMKPSPLRGETDLATTTSCTGNEGDFGPPNETVTPTATTPKKQKDRSSSLPKIDDDVLTIGLPKEQYKPRPSRSRSLRLEIEEPIDYSVPPEKAAKKGAKRSKTMGGGDSTPQKVQQICDMGFTPSTTAMALKKNKGNVNRTVDWLVKNNSDNEEDELAPSRSSRAMTKTKTQKSNLKLANQATDTINPSVDAMSSKQRGQRRVSFSATDDVAVIPKSIAQDAILEEGITDVGAQENTIVEEAVKETITAITVKCASHDKVNVAATSSPQVVISNGKSKESAPSPRVQETHTKYDTPQKVKCLPGPPSKKARRRKTTLDQPESITEELDIIPLEPVKEKKRGRGRPRKDALPVPVVVDPFPGDKLVEQNVDGKENKSVEKVGEPAHQEIQANKGAIEVLPKSGGKKVADSAAPPMQDHPASTPPPKPSNVGAERTPERQLKTANPAHSPINKGKVPYRVGLSKRARIAPLLRVVKK